MNVPTTAAASSTFTGKITEITQDGLLVVNVPGTDYRLHLLPAAGSAPTVGQKVTGAVTAQALRVDAIPAGGRYVEPTFGRPRRVQGVVIATNPAEGTITVAAGVPFACTLTDPRQKPADFPIGTMVSFDVKRGAGFRDQQQS
jgi:hypothetical protein